MPQASITLNRERGLREKEKNPTAELIELKQLVSDERLKGAKEKLDADYVAFIGELSVKFSSRFWWANALSEKNELVYQCYPRLLKLSLLAQELKRFKGKDVLVVCDDPGLLRACIDLLKENAYAIAYQEQWRMAKAGLVRFLKFVVKLPIFLIRKMCAHAAARSRLSQRIDRIDRGKKYHVIKSWIDHRTFKNGRYEDAYFTRLLDFLTQKDIPVLILGDIIKHHRLYLEKIAVERTYEIIPLEYFSSLPDLFRAVALSFRLRKPLKGKILFQGLDVTEILKAELEDAFCRLDFLHNILYYFQMKSFCAHVPMQSFIFTFENYAWEKMCLTAIKEASVHIKCIGFQHAFISNNSFKYFISPEEVALVPKPDKIITMGEVTKRILSELGHWPKALLETGCALRQFDMDSQPAQYGQHKDVLVPFTMGSEESVRILNFLYEGKMADYPHKVILRLHPQTQIKRVLKALKFSLPSNFEISTNSSVRDDLKRCGIVLCTWTTVGVEALHEGLPVIFLDVNPPLRIDPLFEVSTLKKNVSDPRKLRGAVDELLSLKENEYRSAFQRNREYVRQYFNPVTEESLKAFVN